MQVFLAVLSGLCWTAVYVEAIRIGIRQKTYAMPLVALALNLAWEFTYAVVGLNTWATNGDLGNTIAASALFWGLLDLGILWTYLRFGRSDWPSHLPRWTFAAWTALVLLLAEGVQLAYLWQFGAERGGTYAAYGQNLAMSLLFLGFWVARGGNRGQSVVIAAGKLLGTLAPTISFGYLGGNIFIGIVGSFILLLDAIYVILVTRSRP